ncbi:transducin beta-like protein 1 (TgTBL1), putative [Eimeria acervulina]|uniref:Transducin beta-like protein 1 (TgTBL1), putative n=1 Tax=Eimeria acervulina TaxID=5801 RepID=U6GK53_EIMAC|nr:transducin beta-like protein 1 (TgTBL1), putative [Eimeria acervulina]CDI80520.1 transducin beta-like protein 1 (TgTBL1), putative [Eimeria acervulina]
MQLQQQLMQLRLQQQQQQKEAPVCPAQAQQPPYLKLQQQLQQQKKRVQLQCAADELDIKTPEEKRESLGSRAAALPLSAACASWESAATEGEESLLLHEGPEDAAADLSAAAAAAAAVGSPAAAAAAVSLEAAESAQVKTAPGESSSMQLKSAASVSGAAAAAGGATAAGTGGGGGGAAAAAAVDEDTILVGPPLHAFEERVAVNDLLRLAECSDVGEAGALSEWSPVDPQLIVTNFAVGSPRLYRLPESIEGRQQLKPFKELAGPPIASGAANPGSSAHWRPDGSMLAAGYESGHVCVWGPEGSLLKTLSAGEASIICLSFSASGSRLAAACADGKVIIWAVSPPAAAATATATAAAAAGESGVSEAKEGTAEQQEATEWTFTETLTYSHASGVIDLDWSGDRLLASGSIDGTVLVRDADTGVEMKVPRTAAAAAAAAAAAGTDGADRSGSGPSAAAFAAAAAAPGAEGALAEKQGEAGDADAAAAAAAAAAPAAAEVATLRWNGAGNRLAIVDASCVVQVSSSNSSSSSSSSSSNSSSNSSSSSSNRSSSSRSTSSGRSSRW